MVRQMKDSGVEWIGKIPKEWEVRKIKNYYKTQIGFTPNTKNSDYYSYDKDGYDWITIGDLNGTKYIPKTTKTKISKRYIEENNPTIIPKGSLLYSFKLSVGQVAFSDRDVYSNEAIASFIDNENVNLNFLYYSSYMIIENANENIYGARILNQQLIKNASIVFPPLSEQQKIADFLDEKVAEIDSAIEKTKATIEDYEKYKQAIITETITKGLNPDVEMKDSGIDWIGNIPNKWQCKKIKYVTTISRGLFSHRPRNDSRYYGGIYPFIQTGDVTKSNKYITTYSQTLNELGKNVSKKFPKGTLTMTIAANVGDVAILNFDAYFPDSIVGFIPKHDCETIYLYYIFSVMKEQFINSAIISTQLNLNIERVKELSIPYTQNICEQKEIVSYLDKKCSEIDKLITKKEELIKELENYKKSLIYECVTGKREV